MAKRQDNGGEQKDPLICCLEPKKKLRMAIRSLAFSPEDDLLVSGGADRIVRVWDISSQRECDSSKRFDHGVGELAVASGAETVITIIREKSGLPLSDSVWRWCRLRRAVEKIGDHDSFQEMQPHPSNESVAFYCLNRIRVFNLGDGYCIRELPKDVGEKFIFTPNGTGVITTDWENDSKGPGRDAVRLRDASSGQVIKDIGFHDSFVDVLAVSSDGRRAASADSDGTVRIWSLEGGESVATFHHSDVGVRQLLLLPNDERLISVDEEFTVRLWEPGTNDAVSTWMPPRAGGSQVTSLTLSSDGQFAATGEYGGAVCLWDLNRCLGIV